MAEWDAGLFALPAGVDFAAEFVTGLLQRLHDQPPEALAKITIYANSARTLAAIQQAFDQAGPLLLPKLRVVSDLGAGTEFFSETLSDPLSRRLQLARLIDGLLKAQPQLAARQSVPALAHSLADLMTEMQTEGCAETVLDAIDTGMHAQHWQNSLAFLQIAARFYLNASTQDRAARQRKAAEIMAARWLTHQALPDAPVIVAGSTGSHGATRLFMRAVAGLTNGAVVLPGYDWFQPEHVWRDLNVESEDHPQARFAPLIATVGKPRAWSDCEPVNPARNKLVSLALRPAPATDQWIAEGPQLPAIATACESVTLIETDQPETEANVIALAMREAVGRGCLITVFTPDRDLVRRVTAALDRWGLRPDDSAGQPLSQSAVGLFLRQIALLSGEPITLDRLLILLKHPLTITGSDLIGANEARRQARELELYLRANGPVFPDADTLHKWADSGDETRKTWAKWVAEFLDLVATLTPDASPRPLTRRLAELRALAEALASGPAGNVASSALWQNKAGMMCRAVMDQLAAHVSQGPDMTAADFAALIVDELQAQAVRADGEAHPLLRIRGPREARTEAQGTVILAGLNEGSWPQSISPDPWLSRQMRLQAGLTLPDRRIGLAAHDFQQGIAAETVIMTRAKRNAEAETIPSRWLNRLTNLLTGLTGNGGPQALAGMRERGAVWIAHAEAMSRPTEYVPAADRPAPIPPTPPFRELPVTDVSLLIRDPYAVYAKRVLRLRPLNPLRPQPDAALRGQTLHTIIENLLKMQPSADMSADALQATFLNIAKQVLTEQVPWPAARAFWLTRMEKIAPQLVKDELQRLAEGRPQVIEARGRVTLPDMDFRLSARPDRIDLLHDGEAIVYDYKSGTPPTERELREHNKQLILEAAIARRGGFDRLGTVEIAGIRYIQLGGTGQTAPRNYSEELEAENWEGFVQLIQAYLTGQVGFAAKLAAGKQPFGGDYDHLARYGEWSQSDQAKPVKVGDHG